MDQEIRNKLRNVVTQCRKLLEDSVSQELEGKYGIFAKKDQVTADPNAKMTHLTEEEQAARKDILDHFGHIKARGFKPKEALDQLVREIAFTHLNRLCAYKMMEAREVYVGGQKFREAVSRGVNSNGVKFYLADHPEEERLFNTGHQDVAYRHFLDWLGGLLSDEIGVLFNPNDPANRLYPRQKTLDEVLDLLNGGGIKPEETELREEWPKIWSQDETIGWVYQYFTPKELRDQARKESQAPRNSYELAFRNQFFTPRYVVEFLTDNTLGRIWYEMRKGDTKLKDQCRYMVRRPTEIFLKEGEQPPKDAAEGRDDLSQEELLKLPVHIPHRPKKDPRELKILDPACGSGHFLLYCFDLLLTIYEEAYADPDLGPALQKDYPTLEDLRRDVPRLILAHNLHGIDIDLRASQIAALALWLRCQRAYQEMGLKKDRPKITRSNFVCAEPMPGEEQMLKEFVGQLEPKLLGQLVEVVFDKMKLAGEAGSLLKIEEEIREAVAAAKKQWFEETTRATDRKGQPLLFTKATMDRLAGKPEQPGLFDLGDITDDQFFEQAEAKVIEALRQYAEKAQNGHRLQRRLFTDDAVRGFAFVDLCHKRYDVVLMNPPFGKSTARSDKYIEMRYADSWKDAYACFIERALSAVVTGGKVGAITSSLFLYTKQLKQLRHELLTIPLLEILVELGSGVLDTATVDTAMSVLSRHHGHSALFCDLTSVSEKHELLTSVSLTGDSRFHQIPLSTFLSLPNWPLCYHVHPWLLALWKRKGRLEPELATVVAGNNTFDDERFIRVHYEVPSAQIRTRWIPYAKGGVFQPFYSPTNLLVDWKDDGQEMRQNQIARYGTDAQVMQSKIWWYKPGLAYPNISSVGFSPRVLPEGHMFSHKGMAIFPVPGQNVYGLMGVLSSSWIEDLLCAFGRHRAYEISAVANLPIIAGDIDTAGTSPGTIARQGVELMFEAESVVETSPQFILPQVLRSRQLHPASHGGHRLQDRFHAGLREQLGSLYNTLDRGVEGAIFRGSVPPLVSDRRAGLVDSVEILCDESSSQSAGRVLQYAAGVIFGRWDVRLATGQRPLPKLQDPFSPVPICAPGSLQSENGLPAIEAPDSYPFRIRWGGTLVDDPDHSDDIVRRVREVLEVIWKDRGRSHREGSLRDPRREGTAGLLPQAGQGRVLGRSRVPLLQEPPQGPDLLAAPVLEEELCPLALLPPTRQRPALQGAGELRRTEDSLGNQPPRNSSQPKGRSG